MAGYPDKINKYAFPYETPQPWQKKNPAGFNTAGFQLLRCRLHLHDSLGGFAVIKNKFNGINPIIQAC